MKRLVFLPLMLLSLLHLYHCLPAQYAFIRLSSFCTLEIFRVAVYMKFSTHSLIHIHRFFSCLWLTCKIATTILQSTTRGIASYQNDHDAGIPFWNCYKNA